MRPSDLAPIRGCATLPYNPAAQTNRRYVGTSGRQLRRNPALDGWIEDAILLLRLGGVGPARGEMAQYRVSVYTLVSTMRADCSAYQKAVEDAVSGALFGLRRDVRGHVIYPDNWIGSSWAEKRLVSIRGAQRVDVWVAADVIADKANFNDGLHTNVALKLMGFDATRITAATFLGGKEPWQDRS